MGKTPLKKAVLYVMKPRLSNRFPCWKEKAAKKFPEQIYNFEDKSGRKIALRPEITPSMVRIVSSRPDAFPTQGKVYSIGQCFRYERASLGRKREHFQWNIDIVGEKNVVAEAYLIKTAVDAMEGLGFGADDYKVRVNSRQLVSDYLEKIDIAGELAKGVMGVMDKKTRSRRKLLPKCWQKSALPKSRPPKSTISWQPKVWKISADWDWKPVPV